MAARVACEGTSPRATAISLRADPTFICCGSERVRRIRDGIRACRARGRQRRACLVLGRKLEWTGLARVAGAGSVGRMQAPSQRGRTGETRRRGRSVRGERDESEAESDPPRPNAGPGSGPGGHQPRIYEVLRGWNLKFTGSDKEDADEFLETLEAGRVSAFSRGRDVASPRGCRSSPLEQNKRAHCAPTKGNGQRSARDGNSGQAWGATDPSRSPLPAPSPAPRNPPASHLPPRWTTRCPWMRETPVRKPRL